MLWQHTVKKQKSSHVLNSIIYVEYLIYGQSSSFYLSIILQILIFLFIIGIGEIKTQFISEYWF